MFKKLLKYTMLDKRDKGDIKNCEKPRLNQIFLKEQQEYRDHFWI